MDTLSVLVMAIGLNIGLTIAIGAFLFGVFRQGPEEDDDRDQPRHVLGEAIEAGEAMSILCSAISRMKPNWHVIEITRSGDSSASMAVKGDEPDNEPGSLH